MPDEPPTTDPGARVPGVHLLEDLVRDGPPVRRARAGTRGWRPGQPLPAALTAVLAAAVLVVAVVGVVWFRRSAPVDQQLPMTAATGAGADAGVAGGPGSGPGDGAAALPVAVSSTVPAGPLVVHVAGAVARPGVVTVAGGSRVADALTAAGGLRPDADPDRLNLAAVLHDGERVAVPVVGQPAPALAGGAPPGSSGGPAGGSASDDVVGTVDLNTATAAELEALPGVGPSTAAAIVERRTSSGPFRNVEDLLDVRGIGDAKLEQLRAHVTVG